MDQRAGGVALEMEVRLPELGVLARGDRLDVADREPSFQVRLRGGAGSAMRPSSLPSAGASGRLARRVKYAPQRMDLCGRPADGGVDVTDGRLKCLSPDYLSVDQRRRLVDGGGGCLQRRSLQAE